MITHSQTAFGRFTSQVLEDKNAEARMVIIPGKGAGLMELHFGDYNFITGYDKPEELDKNSGARSMPLFPFPNRLAGGKYTWKGKTYEFPITDSAGPNAIHGVGRHTAFKLSHADIGERSALITCSYQDRGHHPGYPWPFTFDMSFRLDSSHAFELEMSFRNDSEEEIPVGFGWHPYFKISQRIDDAVLHLPPCEKIEVDDHMIPTGKRSAFNRFGEPTPIGRYELDNCFAITGMEDRAEVLLKGNHGALRYWQEVGAGKFNFIQLYIPDDRGSLAIEPMTCNIDAFHNKEGLIVLEPGEKASARCGLSVDVEEK